MYKFKDKQYNTLRELRNDNHMIFSDNISEQLLTELGIEYVEPIHETPHQPDEVQSKDPISGIDLLKSERQHSVDNIVVTVDDMTFDGDFQSQQKMLIAISNMDTDEIIEWVLQDNQVKLVTRNQLKQALKLAQQQYSKLWVSPYKL